MWTFVQSRNSESITSCCGHRCGDRGENRCEDRCKTITSLVDPCLADRVLGASDKHALSKRRWKHTKKVNHPPQ